MLAVFVMLSFVSGRARADECASTLLAAIATEDQSTPSTQLKPPVALQLQTDEHWDHQAADDLAKMISVSVDSHSGDGCDMLIPLLAILFIFGEPVILVIVLIFSRYRGKARCELARRENIVRFSKPNAKLYWNSCARMRVMR